MDTQEDTQSNPLRVLLFVLSQPKLLEEYFSPLKKVYAKVRTKVGNFRQLALSKKYSDIIIYVDINYKSCKKSFGQITSLSFLRTGQGRRIAGEDVFCSRQTRIANFDFICVYTHVNAPYDLRDPRVVMSVRIGFCKEQHMSKSLMSGLFKRIRFLPLYFLSSPPSVWHISRKNFTFYDVNTSGLVFSPL